MVAIANRVSTLNGYVHYLIRPENNGVCVSYVNVLLTLYYATDKSTMHEVVIYKFKVDIHKYLFHLCVLSDPL